LSFGWSVLFVIVVIVVIVVVVVRRNSWKKKSKKMDKLLGTAAIFFLITLAGFLIVFGFQYKNMTADNERLTILVTRTAMFLPLYSLFLLISVGKPEALGALQVPIAFVEGYSFYCFLAVLVTNLGGPEKAVEALQGRPLICCTSQCPTEPDRFYNKVVWAVFWFISLRPFVVILGAICDYAKSKAARLLYLLFTLLALAILVRSVIHFVLFYEAVYAKSSNLKGVVKVMLLKFSVGLIVLQGLVEQGLVLANAEPYNDDSEWTKEDKTQRGYCLLVMLEFVLLQVPYLFAFIPVITASPALADAPKAAPKAPTIFHFVFQILCVHDIFGYLSFTGEMQQSLAASVK
jgi:hypothetical protein